MIKILPNTKFSYNLSRGSYVERIKKTEELNQHIFNRILQLYDNKTLCGIGVIKNSYNTILPENKYINILPMQARDYDENGGFTVIERIEDCLTGYSIEVPANVKKKLNILELPSFMHESTHVLDYLFHPKYIANYKKMCDKKIYNKKYFDIYDKWYYNTEDMMVNNKKDMLIKAEEETKKQLKDVPFDEKIIFLNYIKYSMQMEKHAYEQGIKFAKLLSQLKRPVDKVSLDDYNRFLCFDEKLEIINRLIKEEIENYRIELII